MRTWKIDRTQIFLYVVFFLYFCDVAYFLGIRNPNRFPHPFLVFRNFGDVESLRGFTAMLREVIFSFATGGVSGVAVGALVLYSSRLTQAILHFLRVALWFPVLFIFLATAPFISGLTAVTLCSCYHYIGARSLLGLAAREAWTYAAREAILQALFISLISQLYGEHWRWFGFSILQKPGMGLEVFVTLAALVTFINWCCRYDFVVCAQRHVTIRLKPIEGSDWKCNIDFIAGAIVCLAIWQLCSVSPIHFPKTSAYEALSAAGDLLSGSDIWGDIRLSLLEVIGGILFGGAVALGLFVLLSGKAILNNLVLPLLPATNISAVVVWQIVGVLWFQWFGTGFLGYWHKAIAVACLSFFPLVQILWGLGEKPLIYRILIAIDDALPIAFIAMIFGEAWAATKGLGFTVIVTNATGRGATAIAGLLVTFALMAGLSFTLRWVVKRLYSSVEKTPQILDA